MFLLKTVSTHMFVVVLLVREGSFFKYKSVSMERNLFIEMDSVFGCCSVSLIRRSKNVKDTVV